MERPDHFATLSLPRTPWLEAEALKKRFLGRSAVTHPDVGGTAAGFAALNEAWQILRDPATRLRHYLELENPDALALAAATPAELGDLFMNVAGARQEAQRLAAKLAAASSPLARSLLAGERRDRLARLEALSQGIGTRLESAHASLAAGERDPAKLAGLLGKMVFLEKWAAQLREGMLALG
jgi:curved DNA-binding protein CbpA